jgi:5-methylcytosine-specific restriction endonuclease McrA
MPRDRVARRKTVCTFKILPCLRCGEWKVGFLFPMARKVALLDLVCKRCATPHFLIAEVADGMWWAAYERDTRGYLSDHYDEPPFVTLAPWKNVPLHAPGEDGRPYPHYGPINIYRRKRFSPVEVSAIWRQSQRRCHLCQKPWRLNQRSRHGWHIDHVIPNAGGGRDTETTGNFLVACAKCNLQKGRGYTSRSIRVALQNLFS